MRNKPFGSLLLFFIAAVTFACKKENQQPANTNKTPKEILMTAQWKKSEYKENGAVMPFFGSCEMDDVLSFTETNWVLDEGANKCSASTSTDFYVIENDNKTMRWAYGTGEISFNTTNTVFTFKRTGANTFEYSFVKK